MTTKRDKVCRAMDIGLGFTKYTRAGLSNDQLNAGVFPSLAVEAGLTLRHQSGEPNVVTVDVGKQRFLVGENVKQTHLFNTNHFLENTFYGSDQYISLGMGAIASMSIPEDGNLDVLVIGLPYNVAFEPMLLKHINDHFSGQINVPNICGKAGSIRQINVLQLRIVPQTYGSVLALSMVSQPRVWLKDERSLIIDIGFGTTQWLVSDGLITEPNRSGAMLGGVYNISQRMLRSMTHGNHPSVTVMERLDEAFVKGIPTLQIGGEMFDLREYEDVRNSGIREELSQIMRAAGDAFEFHSIFVTGGGAAIYRGGIERVLVDRTIKIVSGDTRFANVKGLQYLAETEGAKFEARQKTIS